MALLPFNSVAQKSDTSFIRFRQAELELKDLQKTTFLSRVESERIEGNKKFIAVWDRIVSNPNILYYAFDSLREISILDSPDKKLRLLTWNLHKDDGTHAYFGYLLVNNSRRIKKGFLKYEYVQGYEFFKLLDRSAAVKSPEGYVGNPEKWFGMLYTQLVACKGYYLLIGWDGNDKLTQRKFVDVLHFKSSGEPLFGKDVFRIPRKNPRRLMFEYSSGTTMSLRYDSDKGMIIYNHLSPWREDNLLVGQYQYYGPDGSFDALRLKNEKWVVVEDFDAKSDIGEFPKNKKPNPKKQKPVYTPK